MSVSSRPRDPIALPLDRSKTARQRKALLKQLRRDLEAFDNSMIEYDDSLMDSDRYIWPPVSHPMPVPALAVSVAADNITARRQRASQPSRRSSNPTASRVAKREPVAA